MDNNKKFIFSFMKLSEIIKLNINEEIDKTPDPEEVTMVLNNLAQIASYAKEAYDLVKDKPNVEEWVQEKIAVCSHELETIYSFLKFNPEEKEK